MKYFLPHIKPNEHPRNNFKLQCSITTKDGIFVGYGNKAIDAWHDMWRQYEMYCDPELHR